MYILVERWRSNKELKREETNEIQNFLADNNVEEEI